MEERRTQGEALQLVGIGACLGILGMWFLARIADMKQEHNHDINRIYTKLETLEDRLPATEPIDSRVNA